MIDFQVKADAEFEKQLGSMAAKLEDEKQKLKALKEAFDAKAKVGVCVASRSVLASNRGLHAPFGWRARWPVVSLIACCVLLALLRNTQEEIKRMEESKLSDSEREVQLAASKREHDELKVIDRLPACPCRSIILLVGFPCMTSCACLGPGPMRGGSLLVPDEGPCSCSLS